MGATWQVGSRKRILVGKFEREWARFQDGLVTSLGARPPLQAQDFPPMWAISHGAGNQQLPLCCKHTSAICLLMLSDSCALSTACFSSWCPPTHLASPGLLQARVPCVLLWVGTPVGEGKEAGRGRVKSWAMVQLRQGLS